MPRNHRVITEKLQNHCIRKFRLPSLILLLALFLAFTGIIRAQPPGNKHFVVTIDAGHGGKDPGAVGKKSKEKNIALAIALKVGHYIESLMDDVDVYYTRKTDVLIPLYERGQIATKNKSDLFISIHVNSNKKSYPYGTTTYVMGFSRSQENLDLVEQENKAMYLESDYKTRYAEFDPNSPESKIMSNIVQSNNLSESLAFATEVQDQFRISANRKDLGVNQGNLIVLWTCAKPSVLIETGFISNPKEEQFLMSDDGQDLLASAIYKAFRNYKESVDKKEGVIGQPETVVASAPSPAKDQPPVVARDVSKPSVQKETSGGSGVEFRIQVLASGRKIPSSSRDFKGHRDLEEFHIDGFYKYMSPPVKSYQEALELQRKLRESFRGAFIVAFKDGVKVPVDSVKEPKNEP